MKTIKIQTELGIKEADVLDEFECNGRKFVVNHLLSDHHYHVVTDLLTGFMVGYPEYGITRAKKKAKILIESRLDFDYSKYTVINGPPT